MSVRHIGGIRRGGRSIGGRRWQPSPLPPRLASAFLALAVLAALALALAVLAAAIARHELAVGTGVGL
eukprot:3174196-Heterocapsa_arctica.AAC.1